MISPNTQAILLLTAPLIAGKNQPSTDILTLGEYKKLARFLRDNQRQPSDFFGSEAKELIEKCSSVIDGVRVERLLRRGFLLSQAIERWQARTIWVMSRADAEYPGTLKAR
jgi:DNA processing protein